MRDPRRIYPCCQKLAEIWSKYPDLRLVQFMEVTITAFQKERGIDAFYAEDAEFLDFLYDKWVIKGDKDYEVN